jgi:glutathione peroxidase
LKGETLCLFNDFKVKDIYGSANSLSEYEGKVMRDSKHSLRLWRFTPQYKGFLSFMTSIAIRDLRFLISPVISSDQASGTSEELANFCQVTFGTKFKTFAKIDVNGKNAILSSPGSRECRRRQ